MGSEIESITITGNVAPNLDITDSDTKIEMLSETQNIGEADKELNPNKSMSEKTTEPWGSFDSNPTTQCTKDEGYLFLMD